MYQPKHKFYTLSLHDALPILNGDTHLAEDVAQLVFTNLARQARALSKREMLTGWRARFVKTNWARSEEHTSELQSRRELVCRPLLEKKKIKQKRRKGRLRAS